MRDMVTATEIVWSSHHRGKPEKYIATPRRKPAKADAAVPVRLEVTLEEPVPCAICGRAAVKGFATYKPRAPEIKASKMPTKGFSYVGVLSEGYGDHYLLPHFESPIVCEPCESVVRDDIKKAMGVVANMDECVFVRGKDKAASDPSVISWGKLWEHILEPPEPPFIIAGNRSRAVRGSKDSHFVPLATVNYSKERFIVSLYDKKLEIDRDLMDRFFIQTGLAAGIVANKTAPPKAKVLFGRLEGLLFRASQEMRRGDLSGEGTEGLKKIAPAIAADPALVMECATAGGINAIRFLRLSMSSD